MCFWGAGFCLRLGGDGLQQFEGVALLVGGDGGEVEGGVCGGVLVRVLHDGGEAFWRVWKEWVGVQRFVVRLDAFWRASGDRVAGWTGSAWSRGWGRSSWKVRGAQAVFMCHVT